MENIFIILFGLTMIYIAATSRLSAHIRMLVVQGVLLFLICLTGSSSVRLFDKFLDFQNGLDYKYLAGLFVMVAETLVIKSVVIPGFLTKVTENTRARRDSEADIPHFYSLVFSSLILFGGFMVATLNTPSFELISPLHFGVSLSVIIISLWLITIKHTVLSNVICFITTENGIFLLSLSAAKEMPVIISLGVLLDLFIAVFILGMLVKEINTRFSDLEVSRLSDLKDFEND